MIAAAVVLHTELFIEVQHDWACSRDGIENTKSEYTAAALATW